MVVKSMLKRFGFTKTSNFVIYIYIYIYIKLAGSKEDGKDKIMECHLNRAEFLKWEQLLKIPMGCFKREKEQKNRVVIKTKMRRKNLCKRDS